MESIPITLDKEPLSSNINPIIPPLKKLNKRQKLFVRHYTAVGTETYGNGDRSRIAAGYKGGRAMATKLLSMPHVKAEVERIEEELNRKADMSREEALKECRANYDKCTIPSLKKQWFDLLVNLSGLMVRKTENKTEVRTVEESDEIAKIIREQMRNPQ